MDLKRVPYSIEEDQSGILDEGWWASVLSDEEILEIKDSSPIVGIQPLKNPINWEKIQELYNQDEIVQLRVQSYNRGGLLVEGDDLQGFVPVSHLLEIPPGLDDDQKQSILTAYIGSILSLKVIECEPSQERVVFSERAACAGQGKRKYLINSLKPGDTVKGPITNVTDFGVFVDLGGLEGLIHVSELSWGRVQHPGDIVEVGQEVTAQVLQISPENARVALSLKKLIPNPWDSLPKNHKPGDVVSATITGIERFGIFARLEEGVEGLIHISSMNLQPSYKSIPVQFIAGQEVIVRILQIDTEKRRLGLSLISCEK